MPRFRDVSQMISEFRKKGYEEISLDELYFKSRGYDRPFKLYSSEHQAKSLITMKKKVTDSEDIYLSISEDKINPLVFVDLWINKGIISDVLQENDKSYCRIWNGTRTIYSFTNDGLKIEGSVRKGERVKLAKEDFMNLVDQEKEINERLAEILYALQSDKRITGLELLRQGKSLQQIPKDIGMSRSGFQKVLECYTKAGLTHREGSGGRWARYKVSSVGEIVLDEFIPSFLIAMDEANQQELCDKTKKL